MENLDRRVCKLRLQSQDEDSISTEVQALQDAFNIASLPGLPPRGLFLIRKLDLGSYPLHSGPYKISKIIDQRVQALGAQSLCVDEGDHPQQNLVWFSDSAQAVFSLVKSVAKSGSAGAWYWRTIFPSWRPGMSLSETLIATSKDFPEQHSKPFVFAQVVEQLFSISSAGTTLSALSADFAQQQISGAGLYPCLAANNSSEPVRYSNPLPFISTHWQRLLRCALADWGAQDVRSSWIAFSALILHNPAIIESTGLQPMITGLIKYHSSGKETIDGYSDNLESGPGIAKPSLPWLETSRATSKPASDDRLSNQPGPRHGIQFTEVELPHGMETEAIPELDRNTLTGFNYTENCGLAFVIALLEWLGMKELLSLNAEMSAINLPVIIVQAIAQRLSIAGTHPVLLAMPEIIEPHNEYIEHFTCPPGWQTLINTTKRDNRLYRYKTKNLIRYITDRSKKLLLHVGDDLPEWMASYQIVDQGGQQACPHLNDMKATIQLLAARYLYRYAKISLRNLVNRRGQIASSNTHLDIQFDSQQVDVHIRIAGLDIDPGWVPWCARVVQFHYSDGGSGDA